MGRIRRNSENQNVNRIYLMDTRQIPSQIETILTQFYGSEITNELEQPIYDECLWGKCQYLSDEPNQFDDSNDTREHQTSNTEVAPSLWMGFDQPKDPIKSVQLILYVKGRNVDNHSNKTSEYIPDIGNNLTSIN